ncbi:MAG: hypothetical protein EOP09_12610, partial [Proteobacteria bacterium]
MICFCRFILSLTLLLTTLTGCGKNEATSTLQWGHLTDLDRRSDPTHYFFGIKKSETLHACIVGTTGSRVNRSWLQAEIYTAVNVWAQAIGRAIALKFDDCAGKPALRIIMGKPPGDNEFVGFTLFEEDRLVYLDPSFEWITADDTLGLKSIPELSRGSWEDKARFLFPLIVDGVYSPFQLPQKNPKGPIPQPTLAILMHEMGHGWGLCDLYDAKSVSLEFNANCSSSFRKNDLSPSDIMSSATNPGTARYALSSSDRAGLRALIARSDIAVPSGYSRSSPPLDTATLLSTTLGEVASQTETATSLVWENLKSPVVIARGAKRASLELTFRTNRPTSDIFISETSGRGPFLTLSTRDGIRDGDGLRWT